MNEEINIAQEIEYLKQEIEQDEAVEGTRDFSSFYRERLDENRAMLKELEDIGGQQ